jgi:hypothetical protein
MLPWFAELMGAIDRRFGLLVGLSVLESRVASGGFETCPAWVAKTDERIRSVVGVFRSGKLPGSKLWRSTSSIARKVRKVSTVARQISKLASSMRKWRSFVSLAQFESRIRENGSRNRNSPPFQLELCSTGRSSLRSVIRMDQSLLFLVILAALIGSRTGVVSRNPS